MEKMVIKKSVDIHASKEKIWNVLMDDHYSRQWYAEFSEGTYAETDWNEEAKLCFRTIARAVSLDLSNRTSLPKNSLSNTPEWCEMELKIPKALTPSL
jgi:hypothetical protein